MTAASEQASQRAEGWHDIELRTVGTELMGGYLLPFFLLLPIILAWPGLVHPSLRRALVCRYRNLAPIRRLVAETILHLQRPTP